MKDEKIIIDCCHFCKTNEQRLGSETNFPFEELENFLLCPQFTLDNTNKKDA